MRIAIAMFGIALLASPALAQETATIRGRIVDASGAPIPGASLTLVTLPCCRIFQTDSESSGSFSYASVPRAAYHLIVFSPGFKLRALMLEGALPQDVNLGNVHLQIGSGSGLEVHARPAPAAVSLSEIFYLPMRGISPAPTDLALCELAKSLGVSTPPHADAIRCW